MKTPYNRSWRQIQDALWVAQTDHQFLRTLPWLILVGILLGILSGFFLSMP